MFMPQDKILFNQKTNTNDQDVRNVFQLLLKHMLTVLQMWLFKDTQHNPLWLWGFQQITLNSFLNSCTNKSGIACYHGNGVTLPCTQTASPREAGSHYLQLSSAINYTDTRRGFQVALYRTGSRRHPRYKLSCEYHSILLFSVGGAWFGVCAEYLCSQKCKKKKKKRVVWLPGERGTGLDPQCPQPHL